VHASGPFGVYREALPGERSLPALGSNQPDNGVVEEFPDHPTFPFRQVRCHDIACFLVQISAGCLQ
jgi:hypothetical protein